MTKESWYQDVQFTRIREHQLATKIHTNEGRPWLVLLHGFPTCSFDWYKMWPSLSEDFQLLCFDFLGFGMSDKPYPHRYSIIEQAELTLALLNHHKISSCYIIAHDYAVSVAQELISRFHDNRCTLHIKKILFLNGGLFSEMHRPRPIQNMLLSPFGKLVNAFVNKSTLAKNLETIMGPDTSLSEHEVDELWELINYNKGKRVFHLLIKYMHDRREHRDRWVRHMQKSSIPMKLVNGPLDPISGIHMVERYQELIPDADTEILENIGHYPNLEAPMAVVEHARHYFQ